MFEVFDFHVHGSFFCVATGRAQGTFAPQCGTIPDRTIAEMREAQKKAFLAYASKAKGIRATEMVSCRGEVLLGFPVDGFAQEGDKVWEVRVQDMDTNANRILRAILWVHADTGNVHYVCGPWDQEWEGPTAFEPPKAEVEHVTGE